MLHVLTIRINPHTPEPHTLHERLRGLQAPFATEHGVDELASALLTQRLLAFFSSFSLQHVFLTDFQQIFPFHPTTFAARDKILYNFMLFSFLPSNAPPVDGSNGYVASRWASEQSLEKAAAALGIPVSIHRFTPAEKGLKATTPVLDEFVRLADRLRLMPELDCWKGLFDMMPSEKAARTLGKALLDHGPVEKETLRFSHHGCEFSMTVSEMREFLEKRIGMAGYERMPILKWVGKIKTAGFGYFFASQDVTMERTMQGRTEALDSRR